MEDGVPPWRMMSPPLEDDVPPCRTAFLSASPTDSMHSQPGELLGILGFSQHHWENRAVSGGFKDTLGVDQGRFGELCPTARGAASPASAPQLLEVRRAHRHFVPIRILSKFLIFLLLVPRWGYDARHGLCSGAAQQHSWGSPLSLGSPQSLQTSQSAFSSPES